MIFCTFQRPEMDGKRHRCRMEDIFVPLTNSTIAQFHVVVPWISSRRDWKRFIAWNTSWFVRSSFLPKFSSTYTLTGKSGSLWDFEVDHGYCEWFGLLNPPLYQAEQNHNYSCHTNRFTGLKVYLIGRNRFNEKQTGSYECAFRGSNYTLDAIKEHREYTGFIQGKGWSCESCRRTL